MTKNMAEDNLLKSLTVYPPHSPPITFAGDHVIGFDVNALAVKIAGAEGEETLYFGLPFSTVSIDRAVVPAGGIFVPGRG